MSPENSGSSQSARGPCRAPRCCRRPVSRARRRSPGRRRRRRRGAPRPWRRGAARRCWCRGTGAAPRPPTSRRRPRSLELLGAAGHHHVHALVVEHPGERAGALGVGVVGVHRRRGPDADADHHRDDHGDEQRRADQDRRAVPAQAVATTWRTVVLTGAPPGRRRAPARTRPAPGSPRGRRTAPRRRDGAAPDPVGHRGVLRRQRLGHLVRGHPGRSESRPRSTWRTATRAEGLDHRLLEPAGLERGLGPAAQLVGADHLVGEHRLLGLAVAGGTTGAGDQPARAHRRQQEDHHRHNADSGGACEALSRPLLTLRKTQSRIRWRRFWSWYSGRTSSRRSLERASDPDGSSGGSGGAEGERVTRR